MSEITFDRVLNLIEKLPIPDQRRLAQALLDRIGKSSSPLLEKVRFREPIPEPDYEPTARWIREHRIEYGGQWVALDKDRLIAHGLEADAVFEAARQDGAYLPLVTFIEPADALPFVF